MENNDIISIYYINAKTRFSHVYVYVLFLSENAPSRRAYATIQ